jgi:hypothetical protein
VRPRREDPRARQTVRRNHPPQLHEFLVPLARIAERRDAVAELPQRHAGIVLDVEVQIDQAGNDRLARQVDKLTAGRRGRCRGRSGGSHPIAADHNPAVVNRRAAGAVDEARVIEHQRLRSLARGDHGDGGEGNDTADGCTCLSDHRHENSGPMIANSINGPEGRLAPADWPERHIR